MKNLLWHIGIFKNSRVVEGLIHRGSKQHLHLGILHLHQDQVGVLCRKHRLLYINKVFVTNLCLSALYEDVSSSNSVQFISISVFSTL